MKIIAAFAGLFVVLVILIDAFETVVLPRRVARRLRLTRFHMRTLWRIWSGSAQRMRPGSRRENYLSLFGPLALILLLATWAGGLIAGFALVQWGFEGKFSAPEGDVGFGTILYVSGSTFFTLGLGDVVPSSAFTRIVSIVEAGTGFILLALVVGYLPVLYQAFSRREALIVILDEWAGSPSTAVGLITRLAGWGDLAALETFLEHWERWAAEVLESHISYPILAGFRSQHGNQSWLAGLTTILDTCALVLTGLDGVRPRPAWLAFAMVRHTAVDLCQVLDSPPVPPERDRLPADELAALRTALASSGAALAQGKEAEERLADLRRQYEPYVNALAGRLLMPLPSWLPVPGTRDNWQKSAWH